MVLDLQKMHHTLASLAEVQAQVRNIETYLATQQAELNMLEAAALKWL